MVHSKGARRVIRALRRNAERDAEPGVIDSLTILLKLARQAMAEVGELAHDVGESEAAIAKIERYIGGDR